MAATPHSQNFSSLIHNLNYDPLISGHKFIKSTAKSHPSLNPSARLIGFKSSQFITAANNINSFGSAASYRRLPAIICSCSSEKITQNRTPPETILSSGINQRVLRYHFSLRTIMEIIMFIWRLPSIIRGFLKKEEKFLDIVEEDINEAADVIQVAAKVVEEVAEGLENVAKTVHDDAEKVNDIMDEVKEKTKVAHDELHEAVDSLEGSMQDVGKSVAKLKAQVKVTKEEATNNPATKIASPPPSAPTSSYDTNSYLLHYNPLQNLNQLQPFYLECLEALHGVLCSLQMFLPHINYESLSNLDCLPKAFIGTLIMFSLCHVFGVMTTSPLTLYISQHMSLVS